VETEARCAWSVESTEDWLQLAGATSGTGSGTVAFRVTANDDDDERDARIRLRSGPGDSRCEVRQAAGGDGDGDAASPPRDEPRPARFVLRSALDVGGGRAQIVLDGVTGVFLDGRSDRAFRLAGGAHRVEALVVNAEGRAGTWRFDLQGIEPGTLRPLGGSVSSLGDGTIVFRLQGRPGERVAFGFRTRD
jgi:hypothetical protein